MQYCLEQRSADIADHFLYSICLGNDVAGEREECANENFTWTITQSEVQKTTFALYKEYWDIKARNSSPNLKFCNRIAKSRLKSTKKSFKWSKAVVLAFIVTDLPRSRICHFRPNDLYFFQVFFLWIVQMYMMTTVWTILEKSSSSFSGFLNICDIMVVWSPRISDRNDSSFLIHLSPWLALLLHFEGSTVGSEIHSTVK